MQGGDKTPTENAAPQALHPEAQALEARPLPLLLRSIVFPLLALVVAALVWAARAQVDRIVVAQGRLITTEPTLVVQPFETGVIRSIDVTVGMKVRRGQVLVTLDPTLVQSSENDLRYRQRSLKAEVERLSAELDERPYAPATSDLSDQLQAVLATQRRSEFQARITGFEAALKRLDDKRSGTERVQQSIQGRLDIAREVEDMRVQLLDREVGSRLSVLQTRQERLALEEQLTVNRAELADVSQQMQKLRADRDFFVQNWRREASQKLVDSKRDLEAVEQQLSAIERRRDLMVLRAPADATVLELGKRSVGSVVPAAEMMVRLVPAKAAIEVEVELGSQDIGHVSVGDAARIKFAALPFDRHGAAIGKVLVISNDALPSRRSTLEDRAFVFPTRLSVDSKTLRDVPPQFHATPGMEVTAEVRVGRRSVMSYFLHPILKVLDENLRQG